MNRKSQCVKDIKVGLNEVSDHWATLSLCYRVTKPSRTPSVIGAVASSASSHSQQPEGGQTVAWRTTCLELHAQALPRCASRRKPSAEKALQCSQPQGNGSLLVFVRPLNHLTFEINSVTSEEDLVTDVTEESDHKTLKTNKQIKLRN